MPESNGLAPATAICSRDVIDGLISSGDIYAARDGLAQFYRANPGPGSAAFVVSRFEQIRSGLALSECRLAILRSFTVEPMVPLLRALAFLGGISLTVQLGDFNAYTQEVLAPGSALYAFAPDVVILAAQASEVAPELWERFADATPEDVAAAVERTTSAMRQLVDAFRAKSGAHLVIHSLQSPALPAAGILDAQAPHGQRRVIAEINADLSALARANHNVYVLDVDALVSRRGAEHWEDRRKWFSARMPIVAGELVHLAHEWLRFLHPLTGRVCKAIAVDLDNTLWGGVIGEDGFEGIRLGPDHKGGAWHDVQRAILDLHRRGIIVAACSKNNPAEAREAIEKHPHMLLRPQHFSVMRINWTDKATNLREIAAELNIGVDSIAFLDDNPAERDWVRRQLPEVTVIELPEDPWRFAAALRGSPVFERLAISDEDRARGKMYAEQRERAELRQTAGSLEDFYRSLEMKADIVAVAPDTLARAAQLTQKTNQFNLTTRRYTEQQLAELLRTGEVHAWTLRVVDRFGDNGIVGLAMARSKGVAWEIDNFLLSCRVIGRTVETAFLSTLVDAARASGADRLSGQFIPTKKNAPAKDFLASQGFREEAGAWHLDLQTQAVEWPRWIEKSPSTHSGDHQWPT